MRNLRSKRFGAHEVKKGRMQGSIHVAPARHTAFVGELSYLSQYLETRVIPCEPEEADMRRVLSDLLNVLEYQAENLIAVLAKESAKYARFHHRVVTGYLSFKAKYDWLKACERLSQPSYNVLEELRLLRNEHIHYRPTSRRTKFSYRGYPLMTRRSIARIFLDADGVLHELRGCSGVKELWCLIPPGYAREMGWAPDHN